jgi:hypothetical protein
MFPFQRKHVVRRTSYQRIFATTLLFNLLLQGCQSRLDALAGHCLSAEVSLEPRIQKQVSGQVSTALATPLSPAPQHPASPVSFGTTTPTATERPQQHAIASQAALQTTQAPSRIFTTSSGAHVRFTHENGKWQALLQSSSVAYPSQRTFPVVSPTSIGPKLAWLHTQDTWTSKARIHIIPTSIPPYTSCVYLGKCGLLGGMFGSNLRELPKGNVRARQASERVTEEIVWVIPSLASLCLESLLTACENEGYQGNTAWALVEAAKVAPEQTLERLFTAFKTRPGIRKTVGEAFVEVAKVAPEYTLDHLLTACKDASTQQAAMSLLKNVAMVIPKPMLISLQAAYQEADPFVRQAAMKTLENVAKAAPELTSACLETIMLAISKDESDFVRESASSVLLEIAKAVPEQALAPLLVLTIGKDESWYARYVIIMALLEVSQAAPKHASACFKPLQDACKDEDQGVRQAAIYALKETKAIIKCYEQGV